MNHTDWSTTNVQLFNFHVAGASVHSGHELSYELTEPHGALSSLIICKSWNRGHCVASSLPCCFAHNALVALAWLNRASFKFICGVPSQSRPSCEWPVDDSPPRSSSKSRHLNGLDRPCSLSHVHPTLSLACFRLEDLSPQV